MRPARRLRGTKVEPSCGWYETCPGTEAKARKRRAIPALRPQPLCPGAAATIASQVAGLGIVVDIHGNDRVLAPITLAPGGTPPLAGFAQASATAAIVPLQGGGIGGAPGAASAQRT